ncbi:hypothetical protein PRIC1_008582 [Phytophthora ramorum]
MATEEVAPNPSAMAAHKAVDEAFPVCRVLGVLQRNGHLSEQSLPPKEPHEHQENRDFINQSTTQSEEIVSESPPSQVDEVSQETDLSKGVLLGSLPCPKCGKTFPSGTSLRSHLADISLCESQPVVLRTEGGKMESKSCFKCGKTFASWQGLRGHLNRVKPCDQEKPAPPTTRRRPAASRTCAKCGKTFSSPQSLRIHMNRVKPCDQDKNSVSTPTTPPAATQPTPTLLMNAEDLKKEAERKAKARYQARKAYLKKRGRLGELGAPPSTLSGDGHNGPNETVSKPDLKRSATDEISQTGENVDSANVEAKRQRVQEEASSEELSIDSPSDVSGLTQPTPPSSIPPQKTLPMGGSFVHRSSKGHGGDLLAGGCSCPPCVRRWARKLMNRMQQLEDEVLTLRKQNSTGVENGSCASSTQTSTPVLQMNTVKVIQGPSVEVGRSLPSAANGGALVVHNVGVDDLSQRKPTDIFRSLLNDQPVPGLSSSNILPRPDTQPNKSRLGHLLRAGENQQRSSTASELQSVGSDQRSLMDAYSHMNDQILLNERTVEDSSGHVQILVGCDPATALDFRKQIDELRVSIAAEKSKRETTVAALIAHEWNPRRDEFKALLESADAVNYPNEEQAHHAKWSEISNQLSLKDKVISALESQMDCLGESGGSSRSRYAEMGELSSKMAAEYSAKMALARDREGIYLDLVKSNTRIRSLVKSTLF